MGWFEVSPWQLIEDIFTKYYGQLENKKSSTLLHDNGKELEKELQAKYPEVGWRQLSK